MGQDKKIIQMGAAPAGGTTIDPNIVSGKTCPFVSSASPVGADPQTGRIASAISLAPCRRDCALFMEAHEGSTGSCALATIARVIQQKPILA